MCVLYFVTEFDNVICYDETCHSNKICCSNKQWKFNFLRLFQNYTFFSVQILNLTSFLTYNNHYDNHYYNRYFLTTTMCKQPFKSAET